MDETAPKEIREAYEHIIKAKQRLGAYIARVPDSGNLTSTNPADTLSALALAERCLGGYPYKSAQMIQRGEVATTDE